MEKRQNTKGYGSLGSSYDPILLRAYHAGAQAARRNKDPHPCGTPRGVPRCGTPPPPPTAVTPLSPTRPYPPPPPTTPLDSPTTTCYPAPLPPPTLLVPTRPLTTPPFGRAVRALAG